MHSEDGYMELSTYIYKASDRIARETIPLHAKEYRARIEELRSRIRDLVIEVRLLDRELSLEAQREWKLLPVIEA